MIKYCNKNMSSLNKMCNELHLFDIRNISNIHYDKNYCFNVLLGMNFKNFENTNNCEISFNS